METSVRVLCLGNDLLADDALGGVVARQLRQIVPDSVDVVFTPNTGLDLLDYALYVRQLIVVDSIVTGNAKSGTLLVFREEDLRALPGGSPHYIGLFEALSVARALDLPAAKEVTIVAVEAEDRTTIGGPLTPAVEGALAEAVDFVAKMIGSSAEEIVSREKSASVTDCRRASAC